MDELDEILNSFDYLMAEAFGSTELDITTIYAEDEFDIYNDTEED